MKTVTIKPCRDCGKAMRPQRTSATDYPGTVIAKGRGLCTWDYQKRTKNGTLDQIPLAWDVNGEDLDRIAQLVILPIATPGVVEVAELPGTERGHGAMGSTGR